MDLKNIEGKIYFEKDDFCLIFDDCINSLKNISPLSIDMIFADPHIFYLMEGKVSIMERLFQ